MDWSADRYFKRDSVDATLDALTRTDYDGQFRMERFVGYGELPTIMCNAAAQAGKLVLGPLLKEVSYCGRQPHVHLHGCRRDVRDQGLAQANICFDVKAMCGAPWYGNTERYNRAFQTIFNHMKTRVISRYPDAECYMTHGSTGNYTFYAVLAPSMPLGMVA